MTGPILIVDDEPQFLDALRRFLEELNYSIITSNSSKGALELLQQNKPALVLFDYKMPDMDGETFLIKAKEVNPEVPFILITAWNDVSSLKKFKAMGVYEVLLKPIDPEKLLAVIKAI